VAAAAGVRFPHLPLESKMKNKTDKKTQMEVAKSVMKKRRRMLRKLKEKNDE